MSSSVPLNTFFDVYTVGLLLEACPFLFPVHMLIVESLMLFQSVVLFPMLSVSIDTSLPVSASPPTFASGVNPLTFTIAADHPIHDSERTIPGLLLPFGVNIIEFNGQFSNIFI